MEIYSKKLMEHFLHPRNVGKIKNYDGLGKVGNLRCGDIMHLYIKFGKNKRGQEIIKKASFLTFGCTVAIANTSLLTTMIAGKTLAEALKITKEDLLKKLGKVPISKIHCSLLAIDALVEAIYNYFHRNKLPIPKELQEKHEKIQEHLKIIEERYKNILNWEKSF